MMRRAINRRNMLRKKITEYKLLHPCKCGEGHPACLDFHHVRGKKSFHISTAYNNGYAWERIILEIQKCEVICRNCHAKHHWSNTYNIALP